MKSADQHLPRESQGGFFHRSSLPLPLFPLPSLPPAFLPQVRVCVNDALVAQAAGPEDRARIVDAICADGREILMHRSARPFLFSSWFSNDAVQRCLEAATGPEEHRWIVACMRHVIRPLLSSPLYEKLIVSLRSGRINSTALDCEEVCLLIVSELFWAASATTLITELLWTPPAPPIFAYIDKSLKRQWAALAYHETGSLVPQRALEKPEESARTGSLTSCSHTAPRYLVRSRRASGAPTASSTYSNTGRRSTAKWRSSTPHCLLEFATNEQVNQSVVKALKEGGKETLDRGVQPAKGARRAIIVDSALAHEERADRLRPPYEGPVRCALRLHPCTNRATFVLNPSSFSSDRMHAYYGY
ncbi:hypothetical protein B0H14DRAFT_3888742 [Mycena olivaceomarginata]|nr:hypothetical protein B0H14DRAFT_3888742 [Mycena olivaceomarginata]